MIKSTLKYTVHKVKVVGALSDVFYNNNSIYIYIKWNIKHVEMKLCSISLGN